MKRRFRLTKTTDFKRVRQLGKSYAHPLVVLIVLPGNNQDLQIGITAGRSVGNAVQRNRAKRLLRAAIQPYLAQISAHTMGILIARKPLTSASFEETQTALAVLFERARMLVEI